ncbi:MAG TPA: hypothetical protein VHG71_13245 [Verrucomicrobiae bacterium]|nr:hypothetical protein [Verrucomicrobiae bacterium]
MKTKIPVTLSLICVTTSALADIANYQSTISSQSPAYYFNFDNSLSSAGNTATFTANGTAGFGADYSGNANGAASFPAASDYLSLSSTIISGQGTATAVGSLSLLFYVPATIPTTGYYFSDGETTGGAANGQPANSAFAFQISSSAGALTLKVANVSITGLPNVTADTWYYLGITYDLNGTTTDINGVNWYLGAIDGSLSSGFKQKGGSGNINSTGTLGDGLGFIAGNKQAAITVAPPGSSTAGVAGGAIDELATWDTALSADQIQAQFNALTTAVPEPSSEILVGIGALLLVQLRRKIPRHS